ncbi:MAG: hypothetical protein AB7F88_19090 [Pyrinomonadaceae bacterium]
MLRLFIDQDFNHFILRGLKSRIPDIDYVTALELGRSREQDLAHLEWALKAGRVIVSHDVNTFTRTTNELIKEGRETPGLIIVPQRLSIGKAVDDLEIFIHCADYGELKSRIEYLPLK